MNAIYATRGQREAELKNQLKLERMKLVAQDRDGPFDMVAGQTDPTEDIP